MIKNVWLILLIGTITACNSPESGIKTKVSTQEIKTVTGLDIAQELRNADSVQCLYFKDPFGKDSLRYTRFFKYYNTHDTALVNPILRNIDQPFILRNEKMNCRSEGKLFFFQKNQALKTVYFNTASSADCTYLYFIKDGAFYYFPVNPHVLALLKAHKKLSKEVETVATN